MDFGDREDVKKRAWQILAAVVIIIVVLFIISIVFKVIFAPTLIGVILVVCVIAYVGYRFYKSKGQSMSRDVEAGRT